MSYLKLIEKEKKLLASLKKVRDEKKMLIDTYNKYQSDKDKLKFVLTLLTKGTINQIMDNILFLDPKLTYNGAKITVNENIEELYNRCEVGTVKVNGGMSYYLLKHSEGGNN